MKVSELIFSLVSYMKEHGDRDVVVDLLTENQSNYIKITGNFMGNSFEIECDINNIREFKRNLK